MDNRSATYGNPDTRYKFTGKERDIETGYDYFGARYYDSRIGRWLSVDPLAEKYPGLSPYNYVADNPMKNFDPNGRYIVNGTKASRFSMSQAIGITAAEHIPGVNFISMGIRQIQGDPSFSPNVGDWVVAGAFAGFGKFLSTATKSFTGLEQAFMRGFGTSMAVGQAGMDALLLGTETLKNLSIDEMVFNKALESGLAIRAKVLRTERVLFKGHGEYDIRTVEVDSDTDIMLSPKEREKMKFKDENEAAKHFREKLDDIKKDIERKQRESQ